MTDLTTSAPDTTIAASDVRCGDRLDDGTHVYDIRPSALTPCHIAIASALDGACAAIVVPADQTLTVTRPRRSTRPRPVR